MAIAPLSHLNLNQKEKIKNIKYKNPAVCIVRSQKIHSLAIAKLVINSKQQNKHTIVTQPKYSN